MKLSGFLLLWLTYHTICGIFYGKVLKHPWKNHRFLQHRWKHYFPEHIGVGTMLSLAHGMLPFFKQNLKDHICISYANTKLQIGFGSFLNLYILQRKESSSSLIHRSTLAFALVKLLYFISIDKRDFKKHNFQ